jgi:hypothetical protein
LRTRAFFLLALLAFPEAASAQAGGIGAGTLSNLGFARPDGSRIAHYSSYERNGGNADFRRIAPGETLTVVDHRGAGIIRRWWLTIAPRNDREIQRRLIVRCWWDGEADPSVEVPVSDFFGMGFGEWRDYISLPLNMTSGGYNCYWPMPFRRSARITVENRAGKAVDAFYYNIDIETLRRVPDNALYFHAQFRRTKPTERGKPVTILETTGRGHYVGTLLSMQRIRGRGLGYLEGDERVFVDGEKTPSIIGTGTEDYFSSGWYFDTGVYSAPYHGVTIKDDAKSRINAYRWHIEDPIAFEKSLRFDIEHGGVNDAPGVDYTSVAYWYQTLPHPKFPPLPADLLPVEGPSVPKIAGIIEAESLLSTARATEGPVDAQDMGGFVGDWSDLSQLWWRPGKSGARLTLTLNAPEARDYEIVGYFTRAEDYGDVQIRVNGAALGPLVRGYNAGVVPTGPTSLGRAPMKAGANEIVVEVVGKDPRSKGYLVGIDGFVLK